MTRRLVYPVSWKGKPVHSAVLKSDRRFLVLAAARRSGKSVLHEGYAVRKTEKPKRLHWYIAPTYTIAKETFWAGLCERFPKSEIKSINRSDFCLERMNGSLIYAKSGDRPDSLLGRGPTSVGIDEYQSQAAHLLEHIVRPSLADKLGTGLITGTPRGYGNPLHDAYERGQDCSHQGQHAMCGDDCLWHDWQSWHLTAYEAGVLAKEEIDAARQAAMAAGPTAMRIWRREWLADFEAFVGRVFESWDPGTMVVGSVPKDFDRIVVGVDWGFSESHAGVMLVCGLKGEQWYVVEEVVAHGETIENYWCKRAQALHAKYGINVMWAPDDRPDGIKSLRRAASSQWATREAKRDPWSGIVALAALMESDKLRVHRSCDTLIKQVASYKWEQTRDGHSKEKPHKAYDDAVDALRHALHSESTGGRTQIWGG